jgi:hypothetical protein
MAPVQSLNNWWFDIININQKDINNIYLVLSRIKQRRLPGLIGSPTKRMESDAQ